MTPEAMRVAINEFLGATDANPSCADKECCCHGFKNYPEDLNACAEMRKCVPEGKRYSYGMMLRQVAGKKGDGGWGESDATAEQHCETFMRVMGIWRDE